MVRVNVLERFLDTGPFHPVDGEYVPFAAFVQVFYKYLTDSGRDTPNAWPPERIRRDVGLHFPIGPGPANKLVIANMSDKFERPRRFVKLDDGRIRLESPAVCVRV